MGMEKAGTGRWTGRDDRRPVISRVTAKIWEGKPMRRILLDLRLQKMEVWAEGGEGEK